MTHELKTIQPYFNSLVTGEKTFEVRINDRDYQVGDVLTLKEYDPVKSLYTGRSLKRQVTYILHGGKYGIHEDFVIMSIVPYIETNDTLLQN